MTAPRTQGSITFTGRPGNLSAVVPADLATEKIVPISVSVAGKPTIYRAIARPLGASQSEIRLRLPDDTPPGTYPGEGTLGGILSDRELFDDLHETHRILKSQPWTFILKPQTPDGRRPQGPFP